jgi:hypothetical protein
VKTRHIVGANYDKGSLAIQVNHLWSRGQQLIRKWTNAISARMFPNREDTVLLFVFPFTKAQVETE